MAKKRKKKKKSRLSFYLVNIILALVIILIIAAGLIYFLCRKEAVEVEGNTILDSGTIEGLVISGDYTDNALLDVVKGTLFPVKDIPFVESYKIRLKDRNTVVITVTEETILGYIETSDGQYAYFNDDGEVVEISSVLVDSFIPLVGLTVDSPKVGEALPLDKDVLELILSLNKNLTKNNVTANCISIADNGDIYVIHDSIYINFGDGDEIANKCMRLPYILPQLEGRTGILHLEDFTMENTDIVFEITEE